MDFDIDVSGEDLFDKDYTICIANKDGIIKGFKMTDRISSVIKSRYGKNIYKYSKSKKGKSSLKIRIYCVAIYYLFKNIKLKENLVLNICRDFNGREKDIESNLRYFLIDKLGLNVDRFNFQKLPKDSNADTYAYLMRRDKKNKISNYVKITINELEKFLLK